MSSSNSRTPFLFLIIGILIIGTGVLVANRLGWFAVGDQVVQNPIKFEEPPKNEPDPIPEDWVEKGGVFRPKIDVTAPAKEDKPSTSIRPAVGSLPQIPKDKTPQTKAVAEALGNRNSKDNELAYRLTRFEDAPKFDQASYDKDPQSYLDDVAPGRINDVLPASKDTPAIMRVGRYENEVLQGESAILRAKTTPFAPVTFYSSRGGSINGGVATATVPSNEEGVAEVKFTATTGMIGELDIVAASPKTSGRARYLLNVIVPRLPADAAGDQ